MRRRVYGRRVSTGLIVRCGALAALLVLLASLTYPVLEFVSGLNTDAPLRHRHLTSARGMPSKPLVYESPPLMPSIREGLAAREDESATERWDQTVAALVAATGAETEPIETAMAKAFRWAPWVQLNKPSWMKPEVPDPDVVASAMQWLKEGPLKLNSEEIQVAVLASPRAYMLQPDKQYAESLATAPMEFRGNAEAYRELLLKEPWMMEMTFHCGDLGACAAECGRCWKPAEFRLKESRKAMATP